MCGVREKGQVRTGLRGIAECWPALFAAAFCITATSLSTFTDVAWDFVSEASNGSADIWWMCVKGVAYPRLAWEFSQDGDFDCPDGVGMDDLVYLAGRWLASTPEMIGDADATGDGTLEMEDYGVMAEHWLMRNEGIERK